MKDILFFVQAQGKTCLEFVTYSKLVPAWHFIAAGTGRHASICGNPEIVTAPEYRSIISIIFNLIRYISTLRPATLLHLYYINI